MGKIFVAFVLTFLLLIYREAIFGNKIIFPSNYFASFYSPWSTQKFPGWSQGIPHKPIGSDELRFFYPARSFTNSEVTAGRFPLWNPYIFSGNPHLANFQSAIFYPLNMLYTFLSQLPAWSILVAIQPFLAAVFCYLFLSSLPIRKVAAVLGAFAFGFSGFIFTWSQEAIAVGQSALWLPLITFGLEKGKQTGKWRYFLVASLALTSSILAGYLQMTFYISLFVLAYAIFRQVDFRKTFLIALLAGGLSAIQLAPSLEGFWLSARPTATIEKVFDIYLLTITHLAKTLAPDLDGNPGAYNYFGRGSYNETSLYIGTIPLVLALYAMWRKRKDHLVIFFLLTTAISYLLTSDFFLTRWLLHQPIPLLPTFQPSRIFILTTFGLAVLSAFGLSAWMGDKKGGYKTLFLISLGAITTLFLILGYYRLTILSPQWLVAAKNVVFPTLMLLTLAALLLVKVPQRFLLATIFVLTISGQWYFANKYLVLGDKQFLYPAHPIFDYLHSRPDGLSRFLAVGQPILGDFATQFKVYSPEGYDPIFSKRYGQLIYASLDFTNGKLSEDIPRIEVTMSQLRATDSGKIAEPMTQNQRRLRLLSLLGVKNIFYSNEPAILSLDEMFPTQNFRPVATLGNWSIFEYRQALPRAFLAGSTILESNSQKILDKIFDPSVDLSQTVILEETLETPVSAGRGTAKIVSYEPEMVKIETVSDSPQLLFLSDNYYPGWKATVDSSPIKIHRADFSFRAVVVPAGRHNVLFNYQPQSFEVGKKITLMSLAILAVGLLYGFLRQKFPKKGKVR